MLVGAGTPEQHEAARDGDASVWAELLAEARATGDPLPLPELVEHAPALPRRARDQLAWFRGLRELFAGRSGEAAQHFRQVRSRAPEYPAAQLELARIELARGQSRAAGERYLQALAEWPRRSVAVLELAELYQGLGRHEEAARYAALVEGFDGPRAQAQLVRARSLAELGRTDEALGALKSLDHPALAAASWLPQAELLRAELALELCQPDEARRALERFEALGPAEAPVALRALWWRDTQLYLELNHGLLDTPRAEELLAGLALEHAAWRSEAERVAERVDRTPSAGAVVYEDADDWPFRGEFWQDELPRLVYAGAGCTP